jgi:hypothetical protein
MKTRTRDERWLLTPLMLALLASLLSHSAYAGDAPPTIKIVEPADKAMVNGPEVTVRVEVSNFTLLPLATGTQPTAVIFIFGSMITPPGRSTPRRKRASSCLSPRAIIRFGPSWCRVTTSPLQQAISKKQCWLSRVTIQHLSTDHQCRLSQSTFADASQPSPRQRQYRN